MTNIKDIFINNIAPEQFHDWAYEKTLREILHECDNEHWLLWILSHVLGVESREFISLKGHCAYTINHIIDNMHMTNACLVAISLEDTNISMNDWYVAKNYAELAQKNFSVDAYEVDNPILIVKSMFSRWIYDDNSYAMFSGGSQLLSQLDKMHIHQDCINNILNIIKTKTQNLT
jgi:hypothetical protein